MIRFDNIPPAPGEAHIETLSGQTRKIGYETLGELVTTAIAVNMSPTASAPDIRGVVEPCFAEFVGEQFPDDQPNAQVYLSSGMQTALHQIREMRGTL